MAQQAPQTYKNHRRFDPLWHFVGTTIVTGGVVGAAVHAYNNRTAWNHWLIVYTLGVALCVFRARVQTLTVQNRLIRLEQTLRLRQLLPPALAARIGDLSVKQLIGLRFAGDGEVAGLVERCLSGELANGEAVKKQIRDWQADWLRA